MKTEMTVNTLKGLVKKKGTRFFDKVLVDGGYVVNKYPKKEVTAFLKQFELFYWMEVEVYGDKIYFVREL